MNPKLALIMADRRSRGPQNFFVAHLDGLISMKIFGLMKLLLVGEVPGARQMWDGIARTAESAEEASRLLSSVNPDVIVVWSAGWGAAWTAQLPPEKRPPCSSWVR